MTKRYTQEHAERLNKQLGEKYPHLIKIDDSMNISYDGIARMVMLDRYSQKDTGLQTLVKGDLVVAKIKNDPKFPTLGTGFVLEINADNVKIQVEEEYRGQIDSAHKPTEDGIITLTKSEVSKPLEIYYEQIAQRIGRHLAEDEKDAAK